jgi:pimeloyl-ACP methyl ester carboxylesterase
VGLSLVGGVGCSAAVNAGTVTTSTLSVPAALARSDTHRRSAAAPTAVTVTDYTGHFADGARYLMERPSNWNGTLLLYSHGYVVPGTANPSTDASDVTTGVYLLGQGFALAGSSYASTGWAVHEALGDQIAVLDAFTARVGRPSRTIGWGESMGGLITAALVQRDPTRFTGALTMCGALGGSVGTWNTLLDSSFAFNTLVARGTLQLVNITNPTGNVATARALLATAQNSAQGRARIALAAALGDIPGWYQTGSPAPATAAQREQAQYAWLANVIFPFTLDLRAEMEGRAGGNPSWNAGIGYRGQLAASVDAAEVATLYAAAGLDLNRELGALDTAATISADAPALAYLSANAVLDGSITVPVLTMQTEGDGLVVNESDQAYAAAVSGAHDAALLRETFVARAGHCAFTPGERIAALSALETRLMTGSWPSLTPSALNAAATAIGKPDNPDPPAFATYAPGPFLRPYNSTRGQITATGSAAVATGRR